MTTGNPSVTILGAGVAGLTAAINLAKAGFHATVLEKRENVGAKHAGDFQGLENWTLKQDSLDYLQSIGIETSFDHYAFNSITHYDDRRKTYVVKGPRPGFYLVTRGAHKGSLDTSLAEQARAAGATIVCGTEGRHHEADIIATGSTDSFLIAAGINFHTTTPDAAYGIFDDAVAPAGYAYLLLAGGKGTLAVVSKRGQKDLRGHLKRAIAEFESLVEFDRTDEKLFGGRGTMLAERGSGRPVVGEAAGFQDAMWGFGLRTAFTSGHLAARSIIEGRDYWSLVGETILPYCKSSVVNRAVYDLLGARMHRYILSGLSRASDPTKFIGRLYRPGVLTRLLYPVARRFVAGKRTLA